jgi:hypothetical protein
LAEFTASLGQAYSHPAREPWAIPSAELIDESDDATDAEPTTVTGNVVVMPNSAPMAGGDIARSAPDADDGDDEEEDDEEEGEGEGDPSPDSLGRARPGPQEKTPEEKNLARAVVQNLLKLDVAKVEKHGYVKGSYRLHLADGRQFDIGDAKVLDSQTAFRVAVIDGINWQIPRLTRKRWDKAVSAILALVETIDTQTPSEMVAEELESYINEKGWFCESLDALREHPEEMLKWMAGVRRCGAPICEKGKGGRVILRLRDFVAWVHRTSKTNLTSQEFANMISRFGFKKTSTIASASFNGKREKLNRVWVADRASLPIDVADDRAHRTEWSDLGDLPVRIGREAVM